MILLNYIINWIFSLFPKTLIIMNHSHFMFYDIGDIIMIDAKKYKIIQKVKDCHGCYKLTYVRII